MTCGRHMTSSLKNKYKFFHSNLVAKMATNRVMESEAQNQWLGVHPLKIKLYWCF